MARIPKETSVEMPGLKKNEIMVALAGIFVLSVLCIVLSGPAPTSTETFIAAPLSPTATVFVSESTVFVEPDGYIWLCAQINDPNKPDFDPNKPIVRNTRELIYQAGDPEVIERGPYKFTLPHVSNNPGYAADLYSIPVLETNGDVGCVDP